MSEFQEKVSAFKEAVKEHLYTAPSDEHELSQTENVETSETPFQGEETHQEDPSQKKKERRQAHVDSLKNRIDQLKFDNLAREAQNRELLSRVQEQERLLAEKQYQLEQNDQYKDAYYENNLFTQEAATINELKTAKEEGDIEKEVALSKDLANIAAQKSTYNLYKNQLKNRNTQPNYEPEWSPNNSYYPQFNQSNVHQEEYAEPENEVLEGWLERNPWADPNSPNFSPRLRGQVNSLAEELDDRLRFNGAAEIIGTSEYFTCLEDIMAEQYGPDTKQKQQSPPPPSHNNYSHQSVAPVSRSGSTMADQYMSQYPNNNRKRTGLTEVEYNLARNMIIRGKDGSWQTGTPEVIDRFIQGKNLRPLEGSKYGFKIED